MQTNRITALQKLFTALHSQELDRLSNYLEHFSSSKSKNDLRANFMFKALQTPADEEQLSEAFLQSFGSKDICYRAETRLRAAVGDTLLSLESVEHEGVYSEFAQWRKRLKRQLGAVEVYIDRGLHAEALDLLKELEEPAKTYELYEELLTLLNLRLQLLAHAGQAKEFHKTEQSIAFYEHCRSANINAKKTYYKAIQNYGFEGNSHSDFYPERIQALSNDLLIIEADYTATQSAMVGFYFFTLKTELAQLQGNFAEASKHCLNLLDVVRNNPSVYQKQRLGATFNNLSQNELFNHCFDYALGFARDAQKHMLVTANNYKLALELEFYALFYSSKTRSASKVLERLFEEDEVKSQFRESWRIYLQACVAFTLQDYRLVHRTLHATQPLNKDKAGWNLGMRILRVMNLLEIGLKDHADAEIDNLTAFLKRSLKTEPVRQRDRLIIKLFGTLKKHNYDYDKTAWEETDTLSKLSSQHRSLSWQVLTPELIVVHKWFEAKLNGAHYLPDYSQDALYNFNFMWA